MKYIRTEDGKLYDLEKIRDCIRTNSYYYEYRFSKLRVNKFLKQLEIRYSAIGAATNSIPDQVGRRCKFSISLNCESTEYKEADTIEELCDKYVCVEPNGEHTVLPSNSLIYMKGTIIYGAIWTDKGLTYVAKMNNEGELELL